MPRLKHLLFLLLLCQSARADWRDDVGHTRLIQTFSTGVPDSATDGVTQVEALESSVNYAPNTAANQLTGKTINLLSGPSGASVHATGVAALFYGNTDSLVPATNVIDAYTASNTAGTGWTSIIPYADTRLVQNHSWIARAANFPNGTDLNAQAVSINVRVDVMANQGSIIVAGVDNNSAAPLPVWLAQGYNLISVGRSDGYHSAGYTVYDGANRIKPDIVSVATTTSGTTGQVSSAAALIAQKLTGPPYSLTGATLPRVTKALLLTGATKEQFPLWNRTDTQPLDLRYGAGQINLLLSYRALLGGPVTAAAAQTIPDTAWANAQVRSSTPPKDRTYFFDVPAGSADSRFSAVLIWHRPTFTGVGGSISYSAPVNLGLTLHHASDFTVGNAVANGTSNSAVDNVEHIYLPALPAGRYALQVGNPTSTTTDYALAWRTSPTVTVAATDDTAAELDGSTATFTLTRTGPVTSPLLVPLTWGGTASPGSHYTTPPANLIIPAGETTATVQITPIPDDLAQGDRTVTLTATTDYSLSAGSPATAAATIADKPFDSWRHTRFSPAQLADPLLSGDTADPDADGLHNLLEYAIDTDPLTATPPPLITALDGDRLAITYLEATGRTDLTYSVETTTDLNQTWSTSPEHLEETARVPVANGEQVTVRRIAPAERQFLRLRVTR